MAITCKEIKTLTDEAEADLSELDSILNQYKIDGKESHLREIDDRLKSSEKLQKLQDYFNSNEYRESVLSMLEKWAKSVGIPSILKNISISKEGRVVVDGNVNLRHLTKLDYFPQIISSITGSLDLDNLTTAQNLTLPQSVGWSVYLRNLTTAENLTLPQSVGWSVYLSNLTTAQGLTLPQSVGGNVYLYSLTTAQKEELRKKHPHLKIF
jgi:hypothetical protein